MNIKNQFTNKNTVIFIFVFICLILFSFVYGDHDFGAYYAGAINFLEGNTPYASREFNTILLGRSTPPFVYPPGALLIIIPFAFFSFQIASFIWFIITVATIIANFYLIKLIVEKNYNHHISWRLMIIVWFSFFAFYDNLELGQIDIIVLLFVLLTIYFQESKPYLAATFLIIGAVIKIFPLVLLIYYIGKKYYPMIKSTLIMGFLILTFNLIIFGFNNWFSYLRILSGHLEEHVDLNYSYGFAHIFNELLKNPNLSSILGLILIIGIVIIITFFYKDKPLVHGAFVVIATAPWFSTIVWPHHLVLMLPMIIIGFSYLDYYKKFMLANYIIFEITFFILREKVLEYSTVLGILTSLPTSILFILTIINIASIIAFFILEFKITLKNGKKDYQPI